MRPGSNELAKDLSVRAHWRHRLTRKLLRRGPTEDELAQGALRAAVARNAPTTLGLQYVDGHVDSVGQNVLPAEVTSPQEATVPCYAIP